jgi:hypothetical protein
MNISPTRGTGDKRTTSAIQQVCLRSRSDNRPELVVITVDVRHWLLDSFGTVVSRPASMKPPETTDDRPIVRAAIGH